MIGGDTSGIDSAFEQAIADLQKEQKEQGGDTERPDES
jgi:hypothetical protein